MIVYDCMFQLIAHCYTAVHDIAGTFLTVNDLTSNATYAVVSCYHYRI